MHMASLVGVPVVSVWGATHPYAGFMGYGQKNENVAQDNELNCRPCSVFGDKNAIVAIGRVLMPLPPKIYWLKLKNFRLKSLCGLKSYSCRFSCVWSLQGAFFPYSKRF